MRADENGLSLLLVTEKILSHLCSALFIKAVERLIKNKYFGFPLSLVQVQPLAHTKRILANMPPQIGGEPHLLHTVADFFLADLIVQSYNQFQFFISGIVGYKSGCLKRYKIAVLSEFRRRICLSISVLHNT